MAEGRCQGKWRGRQLLSFRTTRATITSTPIRGKGLEQDSMLELESSLGPLFLTVPRGWHGEGKLCADVGFNVSGTGTRHVVIC